MWIVVCIILVLTFLISLCLWEEIPPFFKWVLVGVLLTVIIVATSNDNEKFSTHVWTLFKNNYWWYAIGGFISTIIYFVANVFKFTLMISKKWKSFVKTSKDLTKWLEIDDEEKYLSGNVVLTDEESNHLIVVISDVRSFMYKFENVHPWIDLKYIKKCTAFEPSINFDRFKSLAFEMFLLWPFYLFRFVTYNAPFKLFSFMMKQTLKIMNKTLVVVFQNVLNTK